MVLLLVIIGIVLVWLSINTDMFKSNATLFAKYIGQNLENIDIIYQEFETSEYNELLKQNKCTTETQVKVNYTEGMGTTLENTQNSMNQLKLQISGQKDSSNQYNYQDINLLNQDKKVAEVEYIQNGSTYGIRFSDLFNQYLLANNENIKEQFRKAGYTSSEELENIPDTIEFEKDVKKIFEFSKEEKQDLKTKYINIISSNVSKDNFSKQQNQILQIDGGNINSNAYILTLTKEQMNHIYIEILEQVKQDEIILSKMENVQNLIEKYQFSQNINLKEQFIEKVENLIAEIMRNNIGQEEVRIIVYENNQTTVKTIIQNLKDEISIDLLPLSSKNYLKISYQNTMAGEEKELIYKKEKEEVSVSFKNIKNEKITEYSLVMTDKINNNQGIKTIVANYADDSNRLQVMIEQEANIVTKFEQETILNEKNAINLSEIEIEQVQEILQKVNDGITKKVTEIMTNDINMDDLWKILKGIGLMKEDKIFETRGITETEKNRFNSKFEILQGKNLSHSDILKLIDAIKENFIDIEVVSNTELKLKLDRLNKNEEIATILSSFMEENKNKTYDVKVEYDEETGLVSDIVLIML